MKLVPIEMPQILASAAYVDYRKYARKFIFSPEDEDEFKNAAGYIFPWGVIREECIDFSKFKGYESEGGNIYWYFYPTEVYEASLANWENAHLFAVIDVVKYLMVTILESLSDRTISICDNDATEVICLICDIKDYEIAKATLEKDILPKLPDVWQGTASWARNSIGTPSLAFFPRGERKCGPFH